MTAIPLYSIPATPAPRPMPSLPGRSYDTDYDPAAIKRANPLAEAAHRRYGVELQPVGRALVGLCPLHTDVHTPNFHVYPDANPEYDTFRCYRCEISGDVIKLVMLKEEVTYPQACERLGGRRIPFGARVVAAPTPPAGNSPDVSGLPGAVTRRPTTGRVQRRWDCLSLDEQVVMNVAGVIYQRTLWRTPHVLAYLRDRGIPDWVLRVCGLGYADGHSLEAFLRRRSWLRIGQELGLLRRVGRVDQHGGDGGDRGDGSGPVREFFAGRIVVPELRAAQTMWFIARLLDDLPARPGQVERPKYLTLEGERPILGLERAAGRREAFLCEGVFDYLTAVAWGLPAFSPCGTHLAPERLGFLARAATVYGIFDADAAGREATERFAEHLGDRWQPIALPDGCDLNDLGRQPGGRATFFGLLGEARAARAAGGDRSDPARRVTAGLLPAAPPDERRFSWRQRLTGNKAPRNTLTAHQGPTSGDRSGCEGHFSTDTQAATPVLTPTVLPTASPSAAGATGTAAASDADTAVFMKGEDYASRI